MSLVVEAIKGVKAELDTLEHASAKLKRLPKLVGILLSEIVGILTLIPYAVSTMMIYKSLPDLDKYLLDSRTSAKRGVVVKRDVAYGEGERHRLDVYIPQGATIKAGEVAPGHCGAPVVLFIHGGVWASGEKWHYAPMAIRLAQAGVMVVVPSYTLYPEARTPQMVKEVSDALSWVFDHIKDLGGDVDNISLTGHSAGGHLAAMAMLGRAAAATGLTPAAAGTSGSSFLAASQPMDSNSNLDDPQTAAAELAATGTGQFGSRLEVAGYLHGAGTSLHDMAHTFAAVTASQTVSKEGAGGNMSVPLLPSIGITDTRMPARFMGMAGVYDIAKHYEFERSRSVHEISMMKRAMSGIACFAAMSPAVILGAALAVAAVHAQQASAASTPTQQGEEASTSPLLPPSSTSARVAEPSFFSSFQLMGEAIPTRAGLSDAPRGAGGGGPLGALGADLGFPMQAAQHLPPCYLMSSCADHMVPWHEGAEMVAALQRVGAAARHCIYNHVLHSGYVMDWKPLASMEADAAHEGEWAPQQRDFLMIVKGEADAIAAEHGQVGRSLVGLAHLSRL